jgi:hypothetical protein
MDRRLQRDQQLEGTAKPTENAKKAGPQPWELERYIYQEPSTDDGRPSHSDPRLELARRQQQDSEFIPSDGDHEYGYPGFGSYFTPHFDASDEWGTLAGGKGYHVGKKKVKIGGKIGETTRKAKIVKDLNVKVAAVRWLEGHDHWPKPLNTSPSYIAKIKEYYG